MKTDVSNVRSRITDKELCKLYYSRIKEEKPWYQKMDKMKFKRIEQALISDNIINTKGPYYGEGYSFKQLDQEGKTKFRMRLLHDLSEMYVEQGCVDKAVGMWTKVFEEDLPNIDEQKAMEAFQALADIMKQKPEYKVQVVMESKCAEINTWFFFAFQEAVRMYIRGRTSGLLDGTISPTEMKWRLSLKLEKN